MKITVRKENKIKILDLLSPDLEKEAEEVKEGAVIEEGLDEFEEIVFDDCMDLEAVIKRALTIQKAIKGKSEEEVEAFIEKLGYLMEYELMDFEEALEEVDNVEVTYQTLREVAEDKIYESLKSKDDFSFLYPFIDWYKIEEMLEREGYRQFYDYTFLWKKNKEGEQND